MTAISKIIAKNQISNGGPSRFIITWIGLPSLTTLYLPVILVQAENEYSASAANNIYMQAIIDLYRANGIVVREYCIFFGSGILNLQAIYSNHTQRSTCWPSRKLLSRPPGHSC